MNCHLTNDDRSNGKFCRSFACQGCIDYKRQIGTLEGLMVYRVYSGKYTLGHYLNKKDAEYAYAYNSRGENPIDCKYGIEEIEVVKDLKINKDNYK